MTQARAAMFHSRARRPSRLRTAFDISEVIFHATVRNLRKSHGNAVWGLVMSVIHAGLILVVFIAMFDILGMRRFAIRGDFVLYVMSGVFMFLTHTKALAAVSSADAPASTMMMHAPMNPVVAVTSAALASLYQQTLAAAVLLLIYHSVFTPITIHDVPGTLGVYLLSWFSGAGIGLIFYAAKPWHPDVVNLLSTLYQRANMVASGKMFVANMAPVSLRALFDWNPLYHTIDQARGYIFLNYHPRFTSLSYPVYCALVCILIGLMGQFFTRKYASLSWGRRR